MHMAVARLGCKKVMVPGGPILALAALNRLRKRYSHLIGLISGREGCLGSEWVFDSCKC